MWAPHVDPKSLPKSFDQYRGIKPKVSEHLQSAFAAEMAKFNELQKKGNPANEIGGVFCHSNVILIFISIFVHG